MRSVTIIVAFLGLVALVTACSNRQLYTAVQQNQQLECGKLPQQQYEECMRDYAQSYDDFEQERRALIEGTPQGGPSDLPPKN